MYAAAYFPRPPGPFAWQSTKFLQRALLQSARLAHCWTSQPIKVVSTHKSFHQIRPRDPCQWVCERWFIVSRGMRQFVSHDVDTGVEQTLCHWDRQLITWSATCCVTSTRGHLLYVGLQDCHDSDNPEVTMYVMDVLGVRYLTTPICRKLLEFQVDDDSGRLSGPIIFDIPLSLSNVFSCLHLKSGHTPFVFIRTVLWEPLAHTLIFDTRSQIFYEFPKLRPEPVRLDHTLQ